MYGTHEFVELYRKKITDVGYKKITPRSLRTRLDETSGADHSDKLKKLLKKAVKTTCPEKIKEGVKRDRGCIITAILYDKDLKKLAKRMGFALPDVITEEHDPRSHRILIDHLTARGYPDAVHLSKEQLLTLDPDHIAHTALIKAYMDPAVDLTGMIKGFPGGLLQLPQDRSGISIEDVNIIRNTEWVRRLVVDKVVAYMRTLGVAFSSSQNYVKILQPVNESPGAVGAWKEFVLRLVSFMVLVNMQPIASMVVLAMCKNRVDGSYARALTDRIPSMIGVVKSSGGGNAAKPFGPSYSGNSCYMDSVMMSLLAPNSVVVNKYLIEQDLSLIPFRETMWTHCHTDSRKVIQKEVNQLHTNIRGNNIFSCTDLRRAISACPGTQEFSRGVEQDAGEFAQYLLGIFQVDPSSVRTRSYGRNEGGEWDLIDTSYDNRSSPIVDVDSNSLIAGKPLSAYLIKDHVARLDADNLWKTSRGSFSHRRAIVEVLSSSMIIFNVLRVSGDIVTSPSGEFVGFNEVFHEIPIGIDEVVSIGGRQLNLNAIVIHTGSNHYVSVVKVGEEWWWYNDNPGNMIPTITKLGGFRQMMASKPSPASLGTLFFYT